VPRDEAKRLRNDLGRDFHQCTAQGLNLVHHQEEFHDFSLFVHQTDYLQFFHSLRFAAGT
jgi:hypothetical protein